jgi:hypothetical protein
MNTEEVWSVETGTRGRRIIGIARGTGAINRSICTTRRRIVCFSNTIPARPIRSVYRSREQPQERYHPSRILAVGRPTIGLWASQGTGWGDGCGTETQWAKRPRSAQTSSVVELQGECRSFVERDPRSRRPQTLRPTGSQPRRSRRADSPPLLTDWSPLL